MFDLGLYNILSPPYIQRQSQLYYFILLQELHCDPLY